MICLDTNIVIAVLSNSIPSARWRLEEQLRARVSVLLPVVALFELRYGYAKSDRRPQAELLLADFLARGIGVAAFGEEDAAHAGDIRAALEAQGNAFGWYDYLIAAQARCRGARQLWPGEFPHRVV